MSPIYQKFEQTDEREIIPGFFARLIHTDQQTLSLVRTTTGSILPLHQHIHEQISMVMEGQFEMTVNGQTQICRPGDVVIIASNTPHSGKALTDCLILDTFTPAREDYR